MKKKERYTYLCAAARAESVCGHHICPHCLPERAKEEGGGRRNGIGREKGRQKKGCSHTHTHIHTYTRTHTHANTHTRTHTRARALTHTHTRTHAHTHTCTHAHTHTRTHAHTHTHTHTHARTHTRPSPSYTQLIATKEQAVS